MSNPAGRARVDHGVTSGTFSLDGNTYDVENNVWIVGDDTECVVIDAPHDVETIMAVVGERRVKAIVVTHAHDDHCRVAPDLSDRTGAPILLHPDDRPLWELVHRGVYWHAGLFDGQVLRVAGITLQVLHTPGHTPGAVCISVADLGCVFTGDTLFRGGPGATGRSDSDRGTLEGSIRAQLLTLPDDTVVYAGHGCATTIGAERTLLEASATWRGRAVRLPGEEIVP